MDDEIIKKKLLIDGDGIGDDRRINILLKNFIKWCDTKVLDNEDKDVQIEDLIINFEKLIASISQCEYAINKSVQIQIMSKLEVENYENLALKIQSEIEQIQIQINKLKKDLEDAKKIRQNKLIYDEYVETIVKHQERRITLKSLENVDYEIKRLEEIKNNLDESFENKKKKFNNLFDIVYDLQTILKEDNSEELAQEIRMLIDDDYYENLKVDKVEPEIELLKDPNFFLSSKESKNHNHSHNHNHNSNHNEKENEEEKMDTK